MKELLKELCRLDGVSGREDAVRDAIRAKAAPYADEIRQDTAGNLMVLRKGSAPGGQTVMLCAHMDEVGLMVTSVTDQGYLKFGCVGGIDTRVLLGKRVRVGDAATPGVIGVKPIHLCESEEREHTPKVRELYIDIGAADRQTAEKLAAPGDVCAFVTPPEEFGGGFLRAKAIDDRLGCAVLLTLLAEDVPVDTWFVFTVMEEAGTRGAFTAAYALRPDIAVIVEGTTAADLPDVDAHKKVCAPGKGVVIPFMDGGSVAHPELYDRMRALCRDHAIPWQTKELIAGGTDAAAIQRSRAGVKTVGIAAPVRYIHSPVCVVKLDDCDCVLKLARAFIAGLS